MSYMGDDDRILQLIELMKKVEENNQAIKNGYQPFHRDLWCDEVHLPPQNLDEEFIWV